ncbi:hypothetical protein ACR734_01255 [Bifidobacterium breve]|uniref:hypothetical protein n=1 Tax=Bifidobacterium breve TaxID=1685 RepID=UPI001E32EEF2|nr:hypothetical protein [Bifidobacterium breve]MCZ4461131.1 hypothetical protein [Bifidobacterium breve]MCZ4470242.1 hypothetical protein [Bifidobacterium breve]MCZ4477977.1 hypothetical protein [Bifidobacterium breve]MDG5960767.1 hypothetical protein [Bifidobacterium breve]MDK7112584.1 hypothetical protein [Bifidobacterium breve]
MAIGICDAGTPPRNRYVAWARRWDAGTVRWKFVTDMYAVIEERVDCPAFPPAEEARRFQAKEE